MKGFCSMMKMTNFVHGQWVEHVKKVVNSDWMGGKDERIPCLVDRMSSPSFERLVHCELAQRVVQVCNLVVSGTKRVRKQHA